MHEGEPGNRVMILLDGHVKTSSVTDQGPEVVFSFCGPGDILGELSFIDGRPRSSSVTAIEPVEVLVLAGTRFGPTWRRCRDRDYLDRRDQSPVPRRRSQAHPV